jgi:triosephosphate isomerase
MREIIVAGNWKMHKNANDVVEFCKSLKEKTGDIKDINIIIFPPFPYLLIAKEILKDSNIMFGAQNVFHLNSGAYTGEISYSMLLDIGCDYTIIGHSERRKYFQETDDTINKKVSACLNHNLKVIMCIGETLEQREKNQTFEILKRQINEGLKDIKDISLLTIAYEPVWAIGTGRNATGAQAEEVHKFIRELILKMYNNEIALDIEKFIQIIRTTRNIASENY